MAILMGILFEPTDFAYVRIFLPIFCVFGWWLAVLPKLFSYLHRTDFHFWCDSRRLETQSSIVYTFEIQLGFNEIIFRYFLVYIIAASFYAVFFYKCTAINEIVQCTLVLHMFCFLSHSCCYVNIEVYSTMFWNTGSSECFTSSQ